MFFQCLKRFKIFFYIISIMAFQSPCLNMPTEYLNTKYQTFGFTFGFDFEGQSFSTFAFAFGYSQKIAFGRPLSGGVAWWRRPRAQQMDRFWSWPNASIFASFSPNPISAVWLTAYAVVLQGCRCKAKTFCPWMPSAILAHKTTKQAISTGCYYCPQC